MKIKPVTNKKASVNDSKQVNKNKINSKEIKSDNPTKATSYKNKDTTK